MKKSQNPSSLACPIAGGEKRGVGGIRYRDRSCVMRVCCIQHWLPWKREAARLGWEACLDKRAGVRDSWHMRSSRKFFQSFWKKFQTIKNNAEKYALLYSTNKIFSKIFFTNFFKNYLKKKFFTKVTPCTYTIHLSKKYPETLPVFMQIQNQQIWWYICSRMVYCWLIFQSKVLVFC